MRLFIIAASLVIAVALALRLFPISLPPCDERTPAAFVVSTDPYKCDFTRGGGSPW
jgi:hypothetical protein